MAKAACRRVHGRFRSLSRLGRPGAHRCTRTGGASVVPAQRDDTCLEPGRPPDLRNDPGVRAMAITTPHRAEPGGLAVTVEPRRREVAVAQHLFFKAQLASTRNHCPLGTHNGDGGSSSADSGGELILSPSIWTIRIVNVPKGEIECPRVTTQGLISSAYCLVGIFTWFSLSGFSQAPL